MIDTHLYRTRISGLVIEVNFLWVMKKTNINLEYEHLFNWSHIRYRGNSSIMQEFGSRWMSIERKSIWTVHVTNEY